MYFPSLSLSSTPSDDDQLQQQQQQQQNVQQKAQTSVTSDSIQRRIETIRLKRQQIQKLQCQVSACVDEHSERLAKLTYDRQQTLQDYQSVLAKRKNHTTYLELAQKWNITNDCFYIWHTGPFGTINGVRLGSHGPCIATPHHSYQSQENHHYRQQQQQQQQHNQTSDNPITNNNAKQTKPSDQQQQAAAPPPRRFFIFSSSTAAVANNNSTTTTATSGSGSGSNNGTNSNSAANNAELQKNIKKIPWMEVNSALGQVALLLHVLQQKLELENSMPHLIVPMGSTSKIIQKPGNYSYPLSSDDTFSLFGKRSFQQALQLLAECIAHAATCIQRRDRTISIPHTMVSKTLTSNTPEWTIGGLPVAYSPTIEWTRAMKYLLTNCKWLVAFTSKHVDH